VLLRTRWIVGHLLVVVLAAAFVALGVWQLNRNTQKHDKLQAELAAFAAPAPAVTGAGDPAPGTRAEATGTFVADREALLRDQVRGSSAGVDVLTGLRLADGTEIYVDRGWVNTGLSSGAPAFAPPPAGTVMVRGIVQASSPLSAHDDVRTDNGRLAVPRVDLARIAGPNPSTRVRGVWLTAQSMTPAPNGSDAPKLPQPPAPDPVNHLEYAIEWFSFAAIPLIGWPIVLWHVTRRSRTSNRESRRPAPAT